MTTEWKEITGPEELFRLKREGWEIEVWTELHDWRSWWGNAWEADWKFRARPHQPKMKKVKLLAYIGTSILTHVREDSPTDILKSYDGVGSKWIRQPHLDLEGEVPE